ncbi:hypothetical protein EDB81DRAFT_455190 [Dactylonectria macrodidyma]|uniref:BZIP domain-containing protein n=1 Tax=Dactylonectria macrodidyma TaxID=307937 RepID=A0A9P9F705_9HYPO|nr:hypothetical protein EDB81DRAFT_455190 [Dactylonectria macrodidyma]
MDSSPVEPHQAPSRPHAGLGRPQLVEMRAPDDDWTGLTKAADRRRRQNRLNQRAYRRRHAHQPSDMSDVRPAWDAAGYLFTTNPRKRALTYAFMQLVYLQYTLQTPKPVSLPGLIRVNALNALSRNAAPLGIPIDGLCGDGLISPFNSKPSTDKWWSSCPESLRPTQLQLTVPHHPWTDLLPLPGLRDNILRAVSAGSLDEDALCNDLLDATGEDPRNDALLIVWGSNPWDSRGWEASAGFCRKWGALLLPGCDELVASTNRWRHSRGESCLDVRW